MFKHFKEQMLLTRSDLKDEIGSVELEEIHLIALHGCMQAVFLELVDEVLRLFQAFSG